MAFFYLFFSQATFLVNYLSYSIRGLKFSRLQDLILECIQKDKRAQTALYNQYAPILLGVCRRYASNNTEAEEILMNAFLKIFQHINSYSMQGSFEGWMKKICINEALNYQKKFKIRWTKVSLRESDKQENPRNISEEEDLLNKLRSLPKGYRNVFNLFAIEGYKHREIAQMLSISENTSKSQFKKAKNMLQKLCNDEYRR